MDAKIKNRMCLMITVIAIFVSVGLTVTVVNRENEISKLKEEHKQEVDRLNDELTDEQIRSAYLQDQLYVKENEVNMVDIYDVIENQNDEDTEYYSYITVYDDNGEKTDMAGFINFKGIGDCPWAIIMEFKSLGYYCEIQSEE